MRPAWYSGHSAPKEKGGGNDPSALHFLAIPPPIWLAARPVVALVLIGPGLVPEPAAS